MKKIKKELTLLQKIGEVQQYMFMKHPEIAKRWAKKYKLTSMAKKARKKSNNNN